MAEAQFKCPETQPTPARAEGGRGNGAASLPRDPSRTRTHAAPAPAAVPVGLAHRERLAARRAREARRSRARTPARGTTCASPEGGFPRAHAPTATRRAQLPPREQKWKERAEAPLGGKLAGWPTQRPCPCVQTRHGGPGAGAMLGCGPPYPPFPPALSTRPRLGQDLLGSKGSRDRCFSHLGKTATLFLEHLSGRQPLWP